MVSDGWYRLDAFATDPQDDVPMRVGSAEFTHYTDALRSGEKWTRHGVWDVHRARRVIDSTIECLASEVLD